MISNGSLLDKLLIIIDEGNSVTAWYVGISLDFPSHHENSSLDLFDIQIVFPVWNIVRSHDSDLLASGDSSGENSTESVETTLFVSWDHLGDEDHEGTIWIACLDTVGTNIILITSVSASIARYPKVWSILLLVVLDFHNLDEFGCTDKVRVRMWICLFAFHNVCHFNLREVKEVKMISY